jgi:hypothetical protein
MEWARVSKVRGSVMTHYVTWTPYPDEEPEDGEWFWEQGESRWECDEPEGANCRLDSDCECEEWNVEQDDAGPFHKVNPEWTRGWIRHRMFDSGRCLWIDWFSNCDCMSEDPRPGRHEIELAEWDFDGGPLMQYVEGP